ncbi:predicted protein [Streptomyces sp. SPB78]|nr:predicted protein [Streptomyces sp. SPB78]
MARATADRHDPLKHRSSAPAPHLRPRKRLRTGTGILRYRP